MATDLGDAQFSIHFCAKKVGKYIKVLKRSENIRCEEIGK